MRGKWLIRGGTTLGLLCLAIAAALWTMGHLPPDDPLGTPGGTDESADPTGPDKTVPLLGPCVDGVCLTPADPGLKAASDYRTLRLTPKDLDVTDVVFDGPWAAMVASNSTHALLGIIDVASGQWVHIERVVTGTKPIWDDGTLYYVTAEGAFAWDGARHRLGADGQPVASADGPVWACGRSLCGTDMTGNWQRSLWPGHALSIGQESRIIRLADGAVVASGSFWDGLSGDGDLAAWLEITADGTRIRTWTPNGTGTLPFRTDVAPAVSGRWIVYVRDVNVLAYDMGAQQTVVLATIPAGFEAYPVTATVGQVTVVLHPVGHSASHHIVIVGLPE